MGIPGQIRPRNRDPVTKRKKQNLLPVTATPEQEPEGIFVPSLIAENEELLAQWDFIIESAKKIGSYSPSYALLYEQVTLSASLLRKEWKMLNDEGTVLDRIGKGGVVCGKMVNPRAAYVSTLQRNLMGMINQLGLSPRAIQYVLNFDPQNGQRDSDIPVPPGATEKPKHGTVVLFR